MARDLTGSKPIRVYVGQVVVGDLLRGRRVVRLSVPWTEQPTDDTACAYGMSAGQDWYPVVRLQYAFTAT